MFGIYALDLGSDNADHIDLRQKVMQYGCEYQGNKP